MSTATGRSAQWRRLAQGKIDFAWIYAVQSVSAIDAGLPITSYWRACMVGCFELFARNGIGSIAELKGKSVGVQTAGSTLATCLARS